MSAPLKESALAARKLDRLLRLARVLGFGDAAPSSIALDELAEFAVLHAEVVELLAPLDELRRVTAERDRLRRLFNAEAYRCGREVERNRRLESAIREHLDYWGENGPGGPALREALEATE